MANYRKNLVAYDGSASARNGLAVATHLAKEDKSWIKVLSVLPGYTGDLELVGVSNIKETIEGPGKKLLADAQDIADHEDVHILTNMTQGETYEKIVHVADDENCDLIVMGPFQKKHTRGLKARMTNKELHPLLPCPLLIAPQKEA